MNLHRTRRLFATAAVVLGLFALPASASAAGPTDGPMAEPGICKVFPWFC